MIRRLAFLLPLGLLAAGCRTPTEIVVLLDVVGAPPPTITVRLSRSTPFLTDPSTPSFVKASIAGAGAELDLIVTPQGVETTLSLLPPDNGPNDLTVAVTADAAGYTVTPPDPQMASFSSHKSQKLRFSIAAPIPDGGQMDGARDGGPRDSGAPVDAGID